MMKHIKVSKELAQRNSKQIGEWVGEVYSKIFSSDKDLDIFQHYFKDGSFVCLVKVNGRLEISSFYDENKVDFDKKIEEEFLSGLNFLLDD